MLAIKVSGLNQLLLKLDRHKLRVQKSIAKAKVDLATRVFTDVVEGSPQWSGNLAANWDIEVGASKASYSPIAGYSATEWNKGGSYEVGHPLAIGMAMPHLSKLSEVKWNSKINVVNYTPYGSEVEAGQGPNGRPIRPENYVYGQIAMVAYAVMKHGATSSRSISI